MNFRKAQEKVFKNSKINHNLSLQVNNFEQIEHQQQVNTLQLQHSLQVSQPKLNPKQKDQSSQKNLPFIPKSHKNRTLYEPKQNQNPKMEFMMISKQSISNQQNDQQSHRSIEKLDSQRQCRCEARQMYQQLLMQFNEYKLKIVQQKEQQLRQSVKYREHLDRTYAQMKKKYETAIAEKQNYFSKKLQKQEQKYSQALSQYEDSSKNKSQLLKKLRQQLKLSQIEKIQLIENNTKMLYDISNNDNLWGSSSLDSSRQTQQVCMSENRERNGLPKNSYKQLVKLYQFVLEQNNGLKKQLCRKDANNSQLMNNISSHDIEKQQTKPITTDNKKTSLKKVISKTKHNTKSAIQTAKPNNQKKK